MKAKEIVRIHNLINKLYNNVPLNYEQLCSIESLITLMVVPVQRKECWASTGSGEGYVCGIKLEEKVFTGYYYMGLWLRIYSDGSFSIWYYPHDTESYGGINKQIHIYPNGDVIEEHCIDDK